MRDEDIAGAAAPALEPAAALIRKGEWSRARSELSSAIRALGPAASIDTILVAHALLGRACARLQDAACAAVEFDAVTALWTSPDALRRLDTLGGDDRVKSARVSQSLLAAGEALFFAAEQRKEEAARLIRPVYRGDGSAKDLAKFILTGELPAWLRAKSSAIKKAEAAYIRILKLRPAPPPRWAVAARERIGAMWASYADEWTNVPLPKEFEATSKRIDWQNKFQTPPLLVLSQAHLAFRECSEVARRFHIADEHSRACETWLAANSRP